MKLPNEKSRPNHIWVIEIQFEGRRKWEATVGAGLTRRDAKRELEQNWLSQGGGNKCRIRKYVVAT